MEDFFLCKKKYKDARPAKARLASIDTEFFSDRMPSALDHFNLLPFMAKGKSQYCTWYCQECKRANDVTYYNKRRDDEIVKEITKFCPQCHKHTSHKRKDTKKGSGS